MRYRNQESKTSGGKNIYIAVFIIAFVVVVFAIWGGMWRQSVRQKEGYVDMSAIYEADSTEDIETEFMEDMTPAYRYQYQFSGSVKNGEVKLEVYIENGKQIDSVTLKGEDIHYETSVIQGEEGRLVMSVKAPAGTTGIVRYNMDITCRNITWLYEKIHAYIGEPEDTTEEEYQE